MKQLNLEKLQRTWAEQPAKVRAFVEGYTLTAAQIAMINQLAAAPITSFTGALGPLQTARALIRKDLAYAERLDEAGRPVNLKLTGEGATCAFYFQQTVAAALP